MGVASVPYRAESIVRPETSALKLRAEARVGARARSESTQLQRKSEVAVGDEGMTGSRGLSSRAATAIRHKKTNKRNASRLSTPEMVLM